MFAEYIITNDKYIGDNKWNVSKMIVDKNKKVIYFQAVDLKDPFENSMILKYNIDEKRFSKINFKKGAFLFEKINNFLILLVKDEQYKYKTVFIDLNSNKIIESNQISVEK